MLITPLGLLLINTNKRLNIFLVLIFVLSFLATLNGIKQLKFGLTSGEQAFLDNGGNVTHLIFGHLRIFSFFSDASQFGPSQAHIALIALIFAVAIKLSWGKRILLLLLSLLSFYGMLISGTRGAIFVIVIGVIMAIALSKRIKALMWGTSIALFFFCLLKFTYIGNSNYEIYRLRTALNPEDASFNVRLINQKKIAEYLQAKPFGEGLGVIGHWGREYNKGKYLSTIAPDSYWVKVWAMYGIVGLIIFFSIWMYWLGKCSGMLWRLKENKLRTKLIALLAGVAGIFICSYGNEVMNTMPSLIVIHLSLGCIYAFSSIYKEKSTII
jgi:O-antigen ligase